MNFGHALAMLKEGFEIARAGWHGKGMRLQLHKIDGYEPFVVIIVPPQRPGDREKVVPWLASQEDLLAEDWAW
jgi:Protein of unknown function (DUF2829)